MCDGLELATGFVNRGDVLNDIEEQPGFFFVEFQFTNKIPVGFLKDISGSDVTEIANKKPI